MWPVTSEFTRAISGSHEVVIRGSIYFDGSLVRDNVAFDSGSVTVDGNSLVRRTVSNVGVVAEDGDTNGLRDDLSIYGAELLIERGVRFPTGRVEVVPIGRFRIDKTEDDLETPGRLSISGNDLAVRILDDRFTKPRAATSGLTLLEQIKRLTEQSIPGATVIGNLGVFEDIARGIVWEESRLEAIASLAKSCGGVFYALPSGDFALAPVNGFWDAPVWTVSAGAHGVLLGGKRELSRETVRNHVRASGNATNGNDVPTAVAEDDDPLSPTYVGGPFGRVPLVYTSSHIKTTSQATAAALALLSKSLGVQSSLSLTTLVHPALEAGDRIDVILPDGMTERHIVDGFTIPLSASEAMTIQTRAKGTVSA